MSAARAAWLASALMLALGCASSEKRVEPQRAPQRAPQRPLFEDPAVAAAISPPPKEPQWEHGSERCTTDFHFSLAGIHEQSPLDYLSIREVRLRESSYDGSPLRDLAHPKVGVVTQRGTPCARAGAAPDPRCLDQLASGTHRLPPVDPTHLGTVMFVGTRGTEIDVFHSVEELRTLFGTIDTGDEALWLAWRSGYRVYACEARATADGFEIWTDGLGEQCKSFADEVDRVLLQIHADGSIEKRNTKGGRVWCGPRPQP